MIPICIQYGGANSRLYPTLRMNVTSKHVSTMHANVLTASFVLAHVFELKQHTFQPDLKQVCD